MVIVVKPPSFIAIGTFVGRTAAPEIAALYCRLVWGLSGLNMQEVRSDASASSATLCNIKALKDAMLGFLFRRLTAQPQRGSALFSAVTAQARTPFWYREGRVPDTLDGRFAVLATIAALVLVRLEQEGSEGNPLSVALTERFIEVMESEHRQLGLGDPTLGRTVRKLVGMLARRAELWRSASSKADWTEAARASLYKGDAPTEGLRNSADALRSLSSGLSAIPLAEIEKGNIR